MEEATIKVVIRVQRRSDGGLRVWSDDVPGLVLSNKDPQKVLADIKPALEAILSEAFGCKVQAHQLSRMPAAKPQQKFAIPKAFGAAFLPARRKTLEFAALAC